MDMKRNRYPAIAELLNEKSRSISRTGFTSVRGDTIDKIAHTFGVYALIRDCEEEIKLAVDAEERERKSAHEIRNEKEIKRLRQDDERGETIHNNLRLLSEDLKLASEFFAEASTVTKKLGRNW